MNTKKQNGEPTGLTGAFRMEVAWVRAHMPSLFAGLKNFRDIFAHASSTAPRHNYGINKDIMIVLIADALQQQRIEPYQAALLHATNISDPVTEENKTYKNWDAFLSHLIHFHLDDESFNTKRRVLLKMLMDGGLANYDELLKSGLMRNFFHPSDPDYVDTPDDVLVHQNDNIPHDRRPAAVTKKSVDEPQGNSTVQTYAAIPKYILKPLLKEALANKTMNYVQVATMLAVNCHSMERRRSGERYLDHIMSVAADERLTPRQRVLAIMHDLLENSNYTLDDLAEIGIPKSICVSLDHISKRPDERVYLHFIERLAFDPDALAVKMADIRHNSSDPAKTPKEVLKREKYEIALEYLSEIRAGRLMAGYSIEAFARQRGLYKEIHFKPEIKDKDHGQVPPPRPDDGPAPVAAPA